MKRRSSRRNRWSDHYARQARKQRFPARSVFKLQEIQRKLGLIHPSDRVLDLGCAPGSWLLYAAECTGPGGQVVGIDPKPVTVALPGHVCVYPGDILDPDAAFWSKLQREYHVVLSDMAPATTGNKAADAARSYALCQAALAVAARLLLPGGHLVCKIFQGPDFEAFIGTVRRHYGQRRIFKPQSSRKASREIFVIGMGKR
jgi:23S rRNA (uridine2552-2'-O)-methyltransferase